MISRAGHGVGWLGAEAPPRTPPGSSTRELRSKTGLPERQTLNERAGPEPTAASMPAGLQGQALTYKEFIGVVQESGALETAQEAEAAARAVLGALGGCLSWPQAQNLAIWLPKPLRQIVRQQSFESSMSRFSPRAFLEGVAANEHVGLTWAARDTRAVLLALDRTLPRFLAEQLRSQLASLWAPLTHPSVASAPRSQL
jgi:uncharacterized protein (DUF2267 family)